MNRSSSIHKLWWVPDDTEVWAIATQTSEILPNGCVNFVIQRNQRVITMPLEKCLPASDKSGKPDDLVFLSDVNPATILACARERFQDRQIYTSMGMVLMSINPFEVIRGLYGKEIMKNYENPMSRSLDAHVYVIPSRAYYNMCTTGNDQSILISGESGAGKTEATKHCLAYLTEIANLSVNKHSDSNINNASDIANRIVSASPILEAFGNAKTSRNNNSSRFGKWMVLNFDRHNVIHSSNIVSYLLEKSRVTQRDSKERNYHIFYQIIRGMKKDVLDNWGIASDTRIYKYLVNDGDREAVDLSDSKNYKETFAAFLQVGFSEDEAMNIFKIVTAILQIGNLTFNSLREGEASEIKNKELLEIIANKLQVDPTILAHSLCNRCIESGKNRKSVIAIQLNPQKAMETRDSLARTIYDKLFTDIIASINVKNRDNDYDTGSVAASSDRCIGLLDIFGFEIFGENSFEQLCINYCNEMLQQHFNFVIFTSERNLYLQENIICETIEFKDNIDVIKDIETAFKALDEEGRIPKGTSRTWFEKMRRNLKSPFISYPPRRVGDIFVIKHYAGDVDYNANGFLEKNIETINNDLVGTMSSSTDPIIFRMFMRDTLSGANGGSNSRPPSPPQSPFGNNSNNFNKSDIITPPRKQSTGSLNNKSLSWRFSNQLGSLIGMLKKSQSHFIRCIKSNDSCSPQQFDSVIVYKQLIYSGVFEVVKIQQSGLPCRLLHREFVNRYACLIPSNIRYNIVNSKEMLAQLLKLKIYELNHCKIGSNLVFFKSYEQKILENAREQLLNQSSTIIVKFLRMKICHYVYKLFRRSYHQFLHYNKTLEGKEANQAYEEIKIHSEHFHRLVQYDILHHVIEFVEKELSILTQRVELIQRCQYILTTRSINNILSINDLLLEATTLTLLEHPIIIKCDLLLKQYYHTLEFIDISSNTVNDDEESKRKSNPNFKSLNQLTNQEIEEGIGLLHSFQDLMPHNPKILNIVTRHKVLVEQELNDYFIPINNYYEKSRLKFDDATGDLVFFYPEGESYQQELMNLLELLEKRKQIGFKSQDLTFVYQYSFDYLILLHQYIFTNEPLQTRHYLEKTASFEDHHNSIFLKQKADIVRWIEIQLSSSTLCDLLLQNFIPKSDVGDEIPVLFDGISKLLDNLNQLKDPREDLLLVKNVGSWMVKLRQAYCENDWDLLDELVNQIEEQEMDRLAFHIFPHCLEEISNSHWQVIYHSYYSEIIETITEDIFQQLTMDMESYVLLVSTITEDMKMIDDVKMFIEQIDNLNQVPKLNKLIPLVEKILQLRSLMYSKEIHLSKALIQEIKKDHNELIEELKLTDLIEREFVACRRFITKIELEQELNEDLVQYCCLPYRIPPQSTDLVTKDSTIESYQIPYMKLYPKLSESIVKLEKTLGALHQLSNSGFHIELNNKIIFGKFILKTRKLLANQEFDHKHIWEGSFNHFTQNLQQSISPLIATCLSSPGSSTISSYTKIRDSPSNGFQQDDQDRRSFWHDCEREIKCIREELQRRVLLQGLVKLLQTEAILGKVDIDVNVTDKTLNDLFIQYNAMIVFIKTHSNGTSQYPQNLLDLIKFTKEVLNLRKDVFDGKWEDYSHLSACLSNLKNQLPHGGGLYIPNVQREIILVEKELQVREYLRKLKFELQHINILSSNMAPSSSNIDPNQSLTSRKAHSRHYSMAAEQIKDYLKDLNPSETSNNTPVVDLAPLKAALELVQKNNPGDSSKKIIHLAQLVIKIVELLLHNETSKIQDQQMNEILSQYQNQTLDTMSIRQVFDYIKVHNFLKHLCHLLLIHHNSPQMLMQEINALEQKVQSFYTNKFKMWMKGAYLYVQISISMIHEEWVEITEACRQMEDFLHEKLVPLLNEYYLLSSLENQITTNPELPSTSSEHNYEDLVRFINILTEFKAQGYKKAILCKKQQDSMTAMKKSRKLSPADALKTQIRQEDLLLNPYGLGQMRKAGFSDDQLCNLHLDPRIYWAYNFDPSLLKSFKFPANELLTAGYTLNELYYTGGFSILELFQTNIVPIEQFLELGLSVNQLKYAGIDEDILLPHYHLSQDMLVKTTTSLASMSFDKPETPNQVVFSCAVDIPKLIDSKQYSLLDLISIPLSLHELRSLGYTAEEIYDATHREPRFETLYSLRDYMQAGYPLKILLTFFTLREIKAMKFTFKELLKAKFPLNKLLKLEFFEEVEQHVLMTLYQQTNGLQWKKSMNWCSGKPLKEWYGITTLHDEEHLVERVIAIDLIDNGLKGSLPQDLMYLQKMKRLRVGFHNQILFPLPPHLHEFILDKKIMNDLDIDVNKNQMSSSPLPPPSPGITNSMSATQFMSKSLAPPGLPGASSLSREHSKPSRPVRKERDILLELFQTLQGTRWKRKDNWGSELPVSEWYGIKCNSKSGLIVEINLSANNLHGMIPPSIGELTCLKLLDLRINQVRGVIPVTLGQCSSLTQLYCQSNKLSNTIPRELTQLQSLELIDVRSNKMCGDLPIMELRGMNSLRYLGLSSNLFDRSILEAVNNALTPRCRVIYK